MNVRFSERAVRLRVTRAELELLLTSRAVELQLALPRDHIFRVNVRSAAFDGWQLDSDPTGVWLTIPRADLEALAASLPAREGIERSFDTAGGGSVRVSFEVDLRNR